MPRRFVQSLRHALRGLGFVWREERNFRIHTVAAVLIVLAAISLQFETMEMIATIFAMALVLGSEIANTLVEDLLDHLVPRRDAVVGKAKDMMAGIVLINCLAAALIGVLVLVHHFRA